MIYTNEELTKLIASYSKLNDEDQEEEIILKLRCLIRALRQVNHEESLEISEMDFDNKGLSRVFYLLYCLEDEIAKILDR